MESADVGAVEFAVAAIEGHQRAGIALEA